MACVINGCVAEAKCRQMCSKHYTRWYRHGDPLHAAYSHDVDERLWSYVDASGDCWEWSAGRSDHGYGMFNIDGWPYGAHRVVYERLVGKIPEGLDLDHLCRNRGCVNPDHLEPVTRGENLRRSPIVTSPKQADRLNNRGLCR